LRKKLGPKWCTEGEQGVRDRTQRRETDNRGRWWRGRVGGRGGGGEQLEEEGAGRSSGGKGIAEEGEGADALRGQGRRI
jgi:hypothetical protein